MKIKLVTRQVVERYGIKMWVGKQFLNLATGAVFTITEILDDRIHCVFRKEFKDGKLPTISGQQTLMSEGDFYYLTPVKVKENENKS